MARSRTRTGSRAPRRETALPAQAPDLLLQPHLFTTLVCAAGATMVAGQDGLQVLIAATPRPQTAATVVAGWEPTVWQRLRVGRGANGPRRYDWAAVRVGASREQWPGPPLWLLARRSATDPAEVAYYLAHAPADTPSSPPRPPPGPPPCPRPADTPVGKVAGGAASRWAVEQCFEEAKGETGLDQYEVRGGRVGIGISRRRCSPTASSLGNGGRQGKKEPAADALGLVAGLVPVSVPELRRLLALTLPLAPQSVAFHMTWSVWRRQHQGRAKRCHYHRRALSAHEPRPT